MQIFYHNQHTSNFQFQFYIKIHRRNPIDQDLLIKVSQKIRRDEPK